jgi:cytosine/adenosine deaminase-related metal-dependent hydrolase
VDSWLETDLPEYEKICKGRSLVDFTIQNALVPSKGGYEIVDVQIVAGRISSIATGLDVVGSAVDGRNRLLLPGFINAHTHSSELWQRGCIPPLPLELWLAELYKFTPLNPEQIYLGALGTAVETLLSGGTTLVDHLVLIPGQELETIAAAVKAYREVGIRAFIGPLLQDEPLVASLPARSRSLPQESCPYSAEFLVQFMQEVVEQFHRPEQGISIMVAPTGPQLCSDALFKGLVELSDRYHLCRHSHLLETKAQKLLASEKYGRSAVEHLRDLGFLGPRTSLAHCVWLDEADIAILAETQSTVVHNPLSNLRLGSGLAPVLSYLKAGVNVTFGCDGASSNDGQDLLEAIKLGTMLHNVTDPDYRSWMTPRTSIEMATLGGATGLGLANEVGSLRVGQQADLVLYDLTQLSLLPRNDPIGLLVLGRPTQVVDSVWVGGDRIVADGQVLTLSVEALRQQLFERSQWMADRPSTPNPFEYHYRSIMNLPV